MAEGICIPTMAITTLRATSKSQAKNNLYNILSVKTLHWGPRLRNSFIFNDLHKLTQQFSCQLSLGMKGAISSQKKSEKKVLLQSKILADFYTWKMNVDFALRHSTSIPASESDRALPFDKAKFGAKEWKWFLLIAKTFQMEQFSCSRATPLMLQNQNCLVSSRARFTALPFLANTHISKSQPSNIMEAEISSNKLAVRHTVRLDVNREFLSFDVENGWFDVKKMVNKVLVFDNRDFVFSSWNSDTNQCYFCRPIHGESITATVKS